MVSIPISIGELLDKLSILKVKRKQISNKHKVKEVNKEYDLLSKVYDFSKNKKIIDLYNELYEINTKLWKIEDAIRIKEKNNKFDHTFVTLARKVYYTNDKRFDVKNKINYITKSNIVEVKSYEEYGNVYEDQNNQPFAD